MRILVCTSEAPLPPLNGFRVQIIPVCAELAARGHDVCVLGYVRVGQHGEPPPGVELRRLDYPTPARFRSGLEWATKRRPLAPALSQGPMSAAARRLASERSFDVVHVAGWPLANLGPELAPLPSILTTLDAWHLNYAARAENATWPLSLLHREEARRIAAFEADAYRSYRSVVVVTEEDRRALHRLDATLPISVIPNGVDGERFAPRPDSAREPGLVVMTGAMHWPPNVAAARFMVSEVMPRLRRRHPAARLAIVGRSPSTQVRALGAQEGVEVIGEVPEIVDWLARGSAYACPMVSGTGIKNKLLEAMSCACACVATPLACQGLDVEHGRELMIAPSPDEFAAALGDVLADERRGSELGRAAREHVLAHHTWHAVTSAYERLLGDAVEAAQVATR